MKNKHLELVQNQMALLRIKKSLWHFKKLGLA